MMLRPIVEAEDDVYTYTAAENGAGPLWCYGSTVVARQGEDVFVAGLETLPEHAPLHNCRWLLFRRTRNGWELLHRDTSGRTREPSPIALLGSGDLLVSANPTLTEPGARSGPAQPTVFRFDTQYPHKAPVTELPVWQDEPAFTEHSYRTVTADRTHDEVLYMQNVGYETAHMSFLERNGRWQGVGTLRWPWGEEYDPPRPLRLCYPNVFLHDRTAHFFGVGDIVEPVEAWRQAKFEITQREWDYVFRRLFYAYTPDITREPFGSWHEVANRDTTAGAMRNGDVYVDGQGIVHLIWSETNVDARLRDRFFPQETVVHSLEYMALRDGSELTRRTLARAAEGEDVPRPQMGRFHVLADGTLVALAAFGPNVDVSDHPPTVYRVTALESAPAGTSASDKPGQHSEAGVAALSPAWVDVPFTRPMPGVFLTNTIRGGSAPADTVDMVGTSARRGLTLGYARFRLERR